MPYINPASRRELDPKIDDLVDQLFRTSGENPVPKGNVNYVVTRIALQALEPRGGWTYTSLSDAVAALQDAADEIKRRLLGPYEDTCIERNGDLEEFSLDK
ncbi:MAG: hypothetical protein AMXMBFR16_11280 [Candidatus Uhrbacteria bacterium]